jgi:hypothetical protein
VTYQAPSALACQASVLNPQAHIQPLQGQNWQYEDLHVTLHDQEVRLFCALAVAPTAWLSVFLQAWGIMGHEAPSWVHVSSAGDNLILRSTLA